MTSYVAADLRRLVESRANRICEYCLIHESDTYFGCQVDHVIAEKHGGLTIGENLAYACTFCNRAKGTDIGSISSTTSQLIRFFNPRTDLWAEHFALNGVIIDALTAIGEVTVKIFGFNTHDRVLEREILHSIGRYPSNEALQRLAERTA